MKTSTGIVLIAASLLLASCAKMKTAHYLPGTWAVTQVDYVYADTTLATAPDQQQYEFDGFHYELRQQTQLVESGTYLVNLQGTKISFTNDNGSNTLNVLESENEYQRWSTKTLNNLHLEIYLQKIQ
jgi:hypothetical protein